MKGGLGAAAGAALSLSPGAGPGHPPLRDSTQVKAEGLGRVSGGVPRRKCAAARDVLEALEGPKSVSGSFPAPYRPN